eukprot:7882753-Pyramimonas_sp.AAC.1
MKAEMTAEIHADEDSGSSIPDSIIDPPENIITPPGYHPQDPTNWVRESYDHAVYYWTSAPLVESPMFQLNQIIELHGGATRYSYDR